MAIDIYEKVIRNRALVRLDTLMQLRWYAIIGQVLAVLVVAFGFKYQLPWIACLGLVALSVALNLILKQKYKANYRMPSNGAFLLLAYDTLQLGALLFLTGGLQNPFVILLIAPVVVSATSLEQIFTILLGGLAVLVISILAIFHLPLPWDASQPMVMPFVFIAGIWAAIVCTLAFTAIYVFRVAQETRRLTHALSATELVLQQEQHLSAFDGLAAAAAHELGTPLATIALVSKEMQHALPKDSEMAEDAALLRSQAERCRTILQKLSSLANDKDSIVQEQPLTTLLEEEIEPLRSFGITIDVHINGDLATTPQIRRTSAIHYGLGNLIDNAVDFAKTNVVVSIIWDDEFVRLEISDDGDGFPVAILNRIGEPFISSRRARKDGQQRGMGLGMFIAKTLLERSGAELTFSNGTKLPLHNKGAFISIVWDRERLEKEKEALAPSIALTDAETIIG
ncbi:MAG: ActS/PrrB/RegB family redox-sensitive histidine kinase [Rhizobiaceae bacterium]